MGKGLKHNWPTLDYVYYNILYIIEDNDFKYHLFYLGTSFLALTKGIMFFYSLLLTDYINIDATLQYVLKAVTKNSDQLLMTTILQSLVIFIYVLLAWYFIHPDFYLEDLAIDKHGEDTCQSIWACFLWLFAFGPRSSGGIGDMMLDRSYSNLPLYYFRLIYDLSFFIIICIILLNIVFGIIIDTFSTMRKENDDMFIEIHNKCFICELEKSVFDKNGGYDTHILENHF